MYIYIYINVYIYIYIPEGSRGSFLPLLPSISSLIPDDNDNDDYDNDDYDNDDNDEDDEDDCDDAITALNDFINTMSYIMYVCILLSKCLYVYIHI
jgi:hypothetical protein